MDAQLDTEELLQTLHSFTIFFILLAVFSLVALVVITIALIRISKSSEHSKASSEHLRHVIQAQEDERARISAELHDTVAQDLRYLQLIAEQVADAGLRAELDDMLRTCIGKIRRLCYSLAPPDLSVQDLAASVQSLCSAFQQRTGVHVSFVVNCTLENSFPTPLQSLNVYRIVQEALVNVERHAQAEEVSVILRRERAAEARGLYVFITDNGSGFDAEQYGELSQTGGCFGIRGMKQRAASIGGRLGINSMREEGTEISLFVPDGGGTKIRHRIRCKHLHGRAAI